ncbi:MAG: Ig-like domain-containing protein, partial [Rhodoferax sp.]|uniref:tandem-95 repeat protein n=1 Tax=Rhodoferax sp. TaxID=50421 RepID=UPI0030163A82
MNKIYRSIWNEITRTYVAAAEIVQSRGKSCSSSSDGTSGAECALRNQDAQASPSGLQSPPMARRGRLHFGGIRPLVLEPRFMFDGAALSDTGQARDDTYHPVVPDAIAGASATAPRADSNTNSVEKSFLDFMASLQSQTSRTDMPSGIIRAMPNAREIVFIDSGVDDIAQLLKGTRADVEVVLLDANRDPWAQMTAVISTHQNLDAVHLVSHGADGQLVFNGKTYGANSFGTTEAAELTQWQSHLSANADILIYGCNVAAGADGVLLINQMARLTQADVAASTDLTGSAAKGGDWVLEADTGVIESKLAFADRTLDAYDHVLEVPVLATPATQQAYEDTAFSFSALSGVSSPSNPNMRAVVTVTAGSATISDGVSGGTQLNGDGNLAGINAFIHSLTFQGAQNWNGTATVQILVKSDYNVSPGETTTVSFDITVSATNDAPTRSTSSVTLTAINEDQATSASDAAVLNPGATVISLFGSSFSDATDTVTSGSGSNSLAGVLIVGNTANATTQGAWQYGSGSTWTAVGAVSSSNGLFVASADSLRFVPVADYNGTPTGLTVRLSDNSTGTAVPTTGSRSIDVSDDSSKSGGTTRYSNSSNAVALDTSINALNDAPVTQALALTVDKNSFVSFSLSSTDVDAGSNSSTDARVNAYKIVALPSNGILLDGQGNAFVAGATLTLVQATGMKFTPTVNYSGAATFTFQAIDAAGATSSVSTASITVSSVNEAPVVTVPGAQSLNEDGTLTLPDISLADPDAGTEQVQATVSALHGTVTLSGLTGLYQADGTTAATVASGASITVRGSLTAINNALTGASYTPTADYNGPDTLTVAVDDLAHTGPTAKTDSKTIAVTVNPVADKPVTDSTGTTPLTLAAVNEDTQDPNGVLVGSLLPNFFDADGNTLAGVAISTNASDAATQGAWQYSLNNGASWQSVGTVSAGAALQLDKSALLRFVPVANYYGTPGSLTLHAIDNSVGRTFSTSTRLTTDVAAVATDLDVSGKLLTTIITSVNDVFVIETDKALKVNEGETVVLNSSILKITDIEATAANIVYTVLVSGTNLTEGAMQFDSDANGSFESTVTTGTVFTQADLNAGRLQYVHSGGEPTVAQTLAYSVTDTVSGGGGSTADRVLSIKVSPVNDAPVLYTPGQTPPIGSALTANVTEGHSFAFNELSVSSIRVIDPDNTDVQLIFKLESLPVHGSLSFNGQPVAAGVSTFSYADLNKLVYQHDGLGLTADSFTVSLRDGAGGFITATTVNLTIVPENAAPTGIGNLTGSIYEDPTSYGALANNNGTVLKDFANYFLSDSDSGATVGAIAIVGGNTANAGSQGTWQYSTDGTYWSAVGTVNDTGAALVLAPTARVRFSPALNYNGTPPVLQIRVLDNTYTGALSSSSGTSESSGTEVRQTVNTVTRGGTTAISANLNTLSISVTPVNDDPSLGTINTLVMDVAVTGATKTITTSQLSATDVDSAVITYQLDTRPSHGWLLLGGNPLGEAATFTQADIDAGRLIYQKNTDTSTADAFVVTIRDGGRHVVFNRPGGVYQDNASTSLLPITVNIDITNPASVPGGGGSGGGTGGTDAFNDILTTLEDTAITVNQTVLLSNDSGAAKTITSVTSPVNGSVALNSGNITFTPSAEFSGMASFQYTITSDSGVDSAVVTVYVMSVNDAPTLVQTPLVLDEGTVATFTITSLNATDPDNTDAQLFYTLRSLPSNGILYFDSTPGDDVANAYRMATGYSFTEADIGANRIKFAHDGSEDFLSSFNFTLTDGSGSVVDYTFNIDVTPVNDQPVIGTATSLNVLEGASVQLMGGTLSNVLNTLSSGAAVGAYDRDGGGDKSAGLAQTNTLSYTVSSLPIKGEVRLVKDGQTYAAGNLITYDVVTTTTPISLAQINGGKLYYANDGTEATTDTLTFTVNDGSGATNATASAVLTIKLIPVNDDPVILVNSGAVFEHTPLTAEHAESIEANFVVAEGATTTISASYLSAFDSDNTTQQRQFRITSNVQYGQLLRGTEVLGVGSAITQAEIELNQISYRHDGLESTSDFFFYKLSDGGGGNEPEGKFVITIIPVNDAPVITVPTDRVAFEEQPLVISGISITDPDSVALDGSISSSFGPIQVTLTVGSGTLNLTASGSATLGTNQTVRVTVTGSLGDVNATLATLVYTGGTNFNGADAISIHVTDQNATGSGGPLVDDKSLAITVQAVNDAPTLTGISAQSYTEDASAVVLGNVAHPVDVDMDDFNTLNGNWSGATLTLLRTGGANTADVFEASGSLAALTAGQALTVGSTTVGSVTSNASGSLVLTFNSAATSALVNSVFQQIAYRNTNQTLAAAATAGISIDWVVNDRNVTAQGVGGALSVTVTQIVTMTGINDAPVLTAVGSLSTTEGTSTTAVALSTLVTTRSDVDVGSSLMGLAIVGNSANAATQGTWYYSSNGTEWVAIGTVDDSTGALALSAATQVKFVPFGDFNNFNLTPPGLVVRALDNTYAAGFSSYDSASETRVVVNTGSSGGSSAISAASKTIGLSVNAVNDAPTVGGGGDAVNYTEGSGPGVAGTPVRLDVNNDFALTGDVELITRIEDTFASSTLTVLRQSGAISTDRFGLDTTYNTDSQTVSLSGSIISFGSTAVASITDNSSTTGQLVITFNADATQAAVSAVMKRVTYSSVADNPPGVALTLTAVFADGNAGAQGSGGNLTATATFTVNVTNVNDAPVATAAALAPVNEDAGLASPTPNQDASVAPVGDTVANLFGPHFSDTDPSGVNNALAGMAITGNAANATTEGIWQYSVNGGADWTAVPTSGLADDTALVLDTDAKIRFLPNVAHYNGTPGSLTVRLSDGLGFTASSSVSDLKPLATTSTAGWSNPVSLSTSVSQINDQPVISDLNGDIVAFVEAVGVNIAGIAVLLDNNTGLNIASSLADIELTVRNEANFAGATLTVQQHSTADIKDFFVVQNANGISTTGGATEPGPGLLLYNDGSAIRYDNGTTTKVVAYITQNSSGSGKLILTFTADASKAAVDIILHNLAYSNNEDSLLNSIAKTIDITFNDGNTGAQGTGGALPTTAQVTINLTPSNDAPSLTAGATLSGTEADAAGLPLLPGSTTTLGALLGGGNFTDPDGVALNALAGVAIGSFSDHSTNAAIGGLWQVSFDAGANWVNLSTLQTTLGSNISVSKALLLSATTCIQFLPDANANTAGLALTPPRLTVFGVESSIPTNANDTTGHAPPIVFSTSAALADLKTYNTTTDTLEARVSAGSVNIDVTIAAVNDAPLFNATTAWTGSITESPVVGLGTPQQQLVTLANVTDVDLATTLNLTSTIFGAGSITVHIAGGVTGDLFTLFGSPGGVASTNGGAGATDFAITLSATATVAEVNAILEAIRFENTTDAPPTTERAYTITLNDGNNVQAGGNAGGATALAATTMLGGTITITQANDPPAGVGNLTLTALLEDQVANAGTVITALTGYNFIDTDTASPGNLVGGIAVVGNTANSGTQGSWQYSSNGTDWHDIGTVGDTNVTQALVLSVSSKLRFVPVEHYNGTPEGLTVRALDNTYGAGSPTWTTWIGATETRVLLDTSLVGTNSTISNNTNSISIVVTAVNDAPAVENLIATSVNTFVEGQDSAGNRSVLGTPVVLDADVHIADVEIVSRAEDNFGGTTLTVARSNGTTGFSANAEDIFGIEANAQVTLATTVISYSSTAVADITTNSAGQLVITFRSGATSTQVDAVISAINYANSSDTPGSTVTLRYRFNDDNQASVQGSGGSLYGDAVVTVNITAQNDMPLAVDDTHQITEDNTSISGNVLTGVGSPSTTADSDPEGTALTVSAIRTGTEGGSGTTGTVDGSTVLTGSHGTLVIAANGSYTYTLDNTDTAVNKLKTGQSLSDSFTYTNSDGSLTDTAQLTITINGRTDGAPTITPVDGNAGATGQATVTEAGLTDVGNTTESTTGTVSIAALDGLTSITVGGTTVTRAQLGSLGGTPVVIDTGEGTLTLTGYGSSTNVGGITTAGTLDYSYTLKANLSQSGVTATSDTIALSILDEGAATTNTNLVVQIVDDTPTANADANTVAEGVTTAATTTTGNVFAAGSTNDVADRIGADSTVTPVTGISFGGNAKTVGTSFNSTYGSLTLDANGGYTYSVNNTNVTVNALNASQTLTETFVYTITDSDGDTSNANLVITITGTNDAPVLIDTTLSITHTEDDAAPLGVVGTLVSALVVGISDVDNGAAKGIAIVGDSQTNGTWYYSKDNGTNWNTLAATSEGAARLIAVGSGATAGRVYFQPNANYNGAIGNTLTIRAWDTTTDSNGGTADITTVGVGTDRAYSLVTDIVNVTVTAVNDAPAVENLIAASANTFVEGQDIAGNRSVLGTPVVLDADVHIADVEIVSRAEDNFGGTTLTVARSNGTTGFSANAEDIFGIEANAQVTLATTVISYSSTAVADITTNSAGQLVITFRSGATSTQVDAVISAINYANSSDTPGSTVTLRYRFNDDNQASVQGSGGSLYGDAVVTVNITAQNDMPLAVDDTHQITEDNTSISGNVLTGVGSPSTTADSDPEGTALTVSAIRTGTEGGSGTTGTVDGSTVLTGSHGTLVIAANGSYTYTLDNTDTAVNKLKTGQSLSDSFTYTNSDGSLTDTAQLTITINGRTDGAPTITPVDGNAGATGQATVTEAGLTDVGNTTESTTGTVSIAALDGLTSITVGGTTVTRAQLGSLGGTPVVIDTGEGTLTLTGYGSSTNVGGITTAGTLDYSYTLKANLSQSGVTATSDTIALSILDEGAATTNTNLVVQIVDDTPTANADANTVAEGVTTAATTTTGNVFAAGSTNDVADRIGADSTVTPVTGISFGGNAKTVGTSFNSTYGSLTLDANGGYTYSVNNTNVTVNALNASQTLTETFVYTITDSDGDTSNANLVITITGTNDAPVLIDTTLSITHTEDDAAPLGVVGTLVSALVVGISDVDNGAAKGIAIVGDSQTNGTWYYSKDNGTNWNTLAATSEGAARLIAVGSGATAGRVYFQPNANYNGAIGNTLTIRAWDTTTDSNGGTADITTVGVGTDRAYSLVTDIVNVTVTAVNDPATITGDISKTADEDTTITGDLNATDAADGLTDGTYFTVTGAPGHGTATIDAETGAWSYTPTADYNGADSFTVTLTDDDGHTQTQLISLTVTAVADIVADTLSTDEDTAVTANVITGTNAASLDNFEGTPVLTSVSQGSHGSVTFTGAGLVTYTPTANYNGADSFTYTVTSPTGVTETATVSVTVVAVNDPATITGDISKTADED